jgi:hypothetical protein
MSKNRNLFEEAIADAKAIKDMAIANAKAALEESFTPHLQKMLSTKLQELEQEDLGENIDETEDENLYEMDKEKEMTETAEVEEELNLDELLAELEEEKTDDLEEEKDDLEKALMEAEEEEAEEETEEEESEDESEEAEKEEVSVEDMSEEDLKSFVEDVIKDMVAAGELEAGHEDMEAEKVEGGEEEINIDEILAEIEAHEAKKAVKKADKKEDEKLKKELDEAISTIEILRSELNEVNLLNAKLLYTNKIFRSKNLTENKKLKVLSSFDKARTVKETKLVYETILESLKEKKTSPIAESISRASKATGISTGAAKPILESNSMVSRFQKLAGII